jgi:hypothetical protein
MDNNSGNEKNVVALLKKYKDLEIANRAKARHVDRSRAFLNQIESIGNNIAFNIDLIELNFQAVFDRLINKNVKLKETQVHRLWNGMIAEGRYVLKMVIAGVEKIIAVNETTRVWIMQILQDGMHTQVMRSYGSDEMEDIDIENIWSMQLEKVVPVRRIENKDGRFFPHINISSEDLSRYQIYSQTDVYNQELMDSREHCLIHVFLTMGISLAVVNALKLSYTAGVNISKKDLRTISDTLGRNITVCTISSSRIQKSNIKSSNKEANKLDTLNIALFENHYFVFEDTKYSKYSIDNYDDLKDELDFHNIIKRETKNGKIYMTRSDNKARINSLLLVEKLLKAGKFKKLDLVNFEEAAAHVELKEHIYLDNIVNEQRLFGSKDKKPRGTKDDQPVLIYYADCESYVNSINHELQLLGFVGDDDDYVHIYSVMDSGFRAVTESVEARIIKMFLKDMTRDGKRDVLCYFHNLKYDYHLLEPYLDIVSRCEKDGQLYNVVCKYRGAKVELRCSFKMIPMALSKFGEVFALPVEIRKKEAIAYDYYTRENDSKFIDVKEYAGMLSIDDQKVFYKNIHTEASYNPKNEKFNPMSYYKEYLRLDCLVLKKGLQKFAGLIESITGGDDKIPMDIYKCLTISSLTDKYMISSGAYEDIYEVCGNLRAYIAKAVYGGRVCANKKYVKKTVEGKISDYDGVSLYPSAINRLCREKGLSRGVARRFEPNDLNNWSNKHYSILTVKITKVNKTQQMPFLAHKTKDSIKYTNDVPVDQHGELKTIIIDSITLQDYIKFHEIEFELVDGVYWDDGGNNKMGEVIKTLFAERLKVKKSNPALGDTIKLMLNSAYGKTIMKKTKTAKNIVKTFKWVKDEAGNWSRIEKVNRDNYIYNNFNIIKSFRALNHETIEFETICADRSYNRGHVGCAILSTSKRIMNELFDVANTGENGIPFPIYYSDTDSLHCNFDDVEKLELNYGKVYGKKLNGKQLEQFHTDFKLKGAVTEIYATKSIFLGKKSYIDCLESTDKDGNTINGYHIRMKGQTEEGLLHASKKYTDSYFGLYKSLADDDAVDILLNPFDPDTNNKKVLFEFNKGKVSTRKPFYRIACFDDDVERKMVKTERLKLERHK